MIISEKQQWQEFLDWFDDNRHNLPDWIKLDMTMHECRLLWIKRIED